MIPTSQLRIDLSNPVHLSQRRVLIDSFFRAQFGGKFESRREVTIVLRALTKFLPLGSNVDRPVRLGSQVERPVQRNADEQGVQFLAFRKKYTCFALGVALQSYSGGIDLKPSPLTKHHMQSDGLH